MSALRFHKGKTWEFCGNGCRNLAHGPAMAQTLVTILGRPINGTPGNSHLCPVCVKATREAWEGALTPDEEPMGAAA